MRAGRLGEGVVGARRSDKGAAGDRWLIAGWVARGDVGILRQLHSEFRASVENKLQAVGALCCVGACDCSVWRFASDGTSFSSNPVGVRRPSCFCS